MDRLDVLGPLAIAGGFFGIAGFVLILIAIGVAAVCIDTIDNYLSPLAHKNEPFIRVFPLCSGRMTWYGCIILLRHTRLMQRLALEGRDDRVQAIEAAPAWVRRIVVWVYFGFTACIAMAFLFIGVAVFLDKYWL